MKPSERCAKAMHFQRLGATPAEHLLAAFIAEQTGCDEMLDLLEDFAGSGVEWVGRSNSYLTMQVDRVTVKDAKAIVAKFKAEE